jgi:hypothetical protein
MGINLHSSDACSVELRKIAKDLKRVDTGFWSQFKQIPALMGWLRCGGKCVYCGLELVQKGQLIGGAVTTDHLLSRAKSKVGFSSHWNAVPTCAGCSIKGVWDRRQKDVEYPDNMTRELHERLVKEAGEFIRTRRREAGTRFASERSNWLSALERRNALGC